MKTPRHFRIQNPGFVLVVTLSLMILLTVIAVGLLTLASITLRASSQGNAMAIARANARLALMMALGDLQKGAGPDQRITARSDVVDGTAANPRLTGMWKSWDIRATEPPAASEYEQAARDAKFEGWLVSGTDPAATRLIAYAKQAPQSPVTLWGEGTLGADAAANNLVSASKVALLPSPGGAVGGSTNQAAKPTGALAWAVLDEGVKARINTRYADNAASVAMQTAELGAGERPGVEFIAGLERLQRKFFEQDASESAAIDKGVSRLNFGLAGESLAPGVREALMPLTHDVTTQSLGIFTDTARGGLKQDFHSLMNLNSLPADYHNKGVYNSRLELPVSATSNPSDPNWASLREFSRLYRDHLVDSAGPMVRARTPAGWAAGTATTVNRTPPAGVLLLPTIAKVQVLFSLVGRDLYANLPDEEIKRVLTVAEKAQGIHGPQDGHFRNTDFNYDLHLMYTPIITLHNPYNVALEFTNMRVDFVNVPFSMQIFRNGSAQSNGMVPLETMYADNDQGQQGKPFGINLKTKANGIPGSPIFKLMPGEVKMFSPYLNPTLTYTNRGQFWDIYIRNNQTANLEAMPGWRGDGIGWDCDWVAGGKAVDGQATNGRWASCLGIAWNDKIHVTFEPVAMPAATKFVVRISATSGTTTTMVNAIEMDYETNDGLKKFIQSTGATMPMRYPKATTVPDFLYGYELVDRGWKQIKDLVHVKPFALLSVQGKSTSGARDSAMEDGRLATKPLSFAHANIGASSIKISDKSGSEHLANFSHEFDLQLLESGTSNLLDVDLQDRSNFISGHSGFNGTKFGLQYDIPLAPLQTLASLNGANPGGSSGYLPRFAQPIGNSWAHPLIPPNKLMETKTGGNYLDHSFLLNLALYDGFYFSGLAEQSGPFCKPAKTSASLAADFEAGKPLNDPRLILRPPDRRPASDFSGVAGEATAYTKLAAWQMMEGAFNINSTSVQAWKAMLASIHDADALFNQLNKVTGATSLTALSPPVAGKSTRISRFRLPASKSAADGGDSADGYWLGARELSDAELQKLAENIVKQVKLRGPFLSMAEFVNRRLGAESDPKAQRGALQQAIDDSDLNAGLAATAGQGGAGFEIPAAAVTNYRYANPTAGTGSSYQGAPGYLSQADLLNVLGNAATARSDTFTVRGYGEARDEQGNITARATCEAIVQRHAEWLDPIDPVEALPSELRSRANQTFGRRFLITSFRWLNSKEI